jgi:hypothetical protein
MPGMAKVLTPPVAWKAEAVQGGGVLDRLAQRSGGADAGNGTFDISCDHLFDTMEG